MLGRIPRRAVAATLAAAAVLIPASPALAHYCFKEFNLASNVAKSNAWVTAEEWAAFLPFIEQDLINEGCEDPDLSPVANALAAAEPGTMFMGPGVLAGGAVHQGKAPKKIGHLPFDQVIAGCFAEAAH